MKSSETRQKKLDALFERKQKKMFVNQIINGNTFMTAEERFPIKIKDVDFLSSKDELRLLIWNKNVMVKQLYIDDNKCIVSEVFLGDEPLKKLLSSQ